MKFCSDYLDDDDIIEKLDVIGVRVDVLDSDPPKFTIQITPEQLGELLDWTADRSASFACAVP